MADLTFSPAVHDMTAHSRARARRTLAACSVLAFSVLLGACEDRTITALQLDGARLELVPELDPNSLILVDPHAAELRVGHGIIIRARVRDAAGEIIADARPAWRTTDAAVAALNALPDSVSAPGARVAVAGVATGEALVIATYQNLADTTVITVRAQTDTAGHAPPPPAPPPPAPAPRPTTFNASITVLGFVQGADTSSAGSSGVPGSVVTLTLLPPIAGDSLPPGVLPVTEATVFGTVTVGTASRAQFTGVPQSRFRVDVVPPTGSVWQSATFTSGVPQVAEYGRVVLLHKP